MSVLSFLETKRIKFHLMAVEKELRNKDVNGLSPMLGKRRLRNLDLLRDYWQNEKFPVNTEYPGKFLTHIKDGKGTLCAMAYVIQKSGNKKLVDSLVIKDNLIRFEKLDESNIELINWISSSGLTKKESAKIQPAYGGYPSPTILPLDSFPTCDSFTPFWVSFVLMLVVLEYINFKLVKILNIPKLRIKYLAHMYLALAAFTLSVIFGISIMWFFILL